MTLQPLDKLPEKPLTIKRALLSVSDKTGIIPLAKKLDELDIEIISTGGTAEALRDENIPVTEVRDVTGFRECLEGRVKTLHPHIHAGILARTSYQPDRDELEELDIRPIQLVVANLYPFKQVTAKPDVSLAEATEYIDIGGPTMIRAAAKNFAHVCVVTDPGRYESVINELDGQGQVGFELRKELARQAFIHTADYDTHIANYFNSLFDEPNPPQLAISLPKSRELRYGENPHQMAAVYGDQSDYIDCFHGKELSYNNFLDVDAALNLIADFNDSDPVCAIFKHTVPCGVAVSGTLKTAWEKAFSTDTVSPFGGIVIVNRELDIETAEAIDEIFTEIIIAPSYSEKARNLLQEKKNRRLIKLKRFLRGTNDRHFRSIFGGALSQESDAIDESKQNFKVVTKRTPSEQEEIDLLFAWKIVKHVKSNAIVYARDGRTVGIGSGQTSRVESSEVAIAKARKEGLSLKNTVVASDAFFPFADGVEAAAKSGATAVIQPGGSIRDEEVIEMANRHDMAMILTGNRHFRH